MCARTHNDLSDGPREETDETQPADCTNAQCLPHCRAKGCVGVLKVSSTTWGGFISVGGKKEALRMVQESVSAQGDKSQVDGVCVLHSRW